MSLVRRQNLVHDKIWSTYKIRLACAAGPWRARFQRCPDTGDCKVGFFEAGHPLFVRVLYLRVTATSSAHRTVKNRISPERSLFMESVKI